jgi:hypothetical protein
VTDTGNTHMNDRKQPQVAVGADRGTLIGNMGREKRMPVVRSAVLRQHAAGKGKVCHRREMVRDSDTCMN